MINTLQIKNDFCEVSIVIFLIFLIYFFKVLQRKELNLLGGICLNSVLLFLDKAGELEFRWCVFCLVPWALALSTQCKCILLEVIYIFFIFLHTFWFEEIFHGKSICYGILMMHFPRPSRLGTRSH